MATEKILNARYQLKVDTTAHWALATNFIPKKGEPIIYQDINETDNTQQIKIKIGDGTTTVINLPFTLEPIKKFTVSATNANSYTGVSFEEIADAVAQQGTCFCELEDLSLILPLVQVEAGSFKFNLVDNQIEYTLVSYFDEEILTLNTHTLGSSSTNYGVCATAAATAEKTVEIEGFELKEGVSVNIKFIEKNAAYGATLNINNTGAKPIRQYGSTVIGTGAATGWAPGAIQHFTYDGEAWYRDYWRDTNTNIQLGQGYATCSTAAATTAKVVTLSGYALQTGGIVAIKFAYAVPANATLNINSTGAKNIYYKGTNIISDVIQAGDLVTFMYDGTQYHLLTIDRLVDIQNAINDLNTISNQFTLYTDENRLAFTGKNFTPLSSSKMSNLGDDYNYWNNIYLQGGINVSSSLGSANISTSSLYYLKDVQENVQNKLILLTNGYNELSNKLDSINGTSSNTSPKVMSIFKPFDTPEATLPYNVAYGQVGFDETNLTPWVYAPYTTYTVTWDGNYLNQTAGSNTVVDPTTMPTLLSRGYNYLIDTSTDTVYSIFSATESADSSVNSGSTPDIGTISTGNELSGDLSLVYDTANNTRWYPTSGWDTSFLKTNTTYKLCMMEWQPFLQPAETSSF